MSTIAALTHPSELVVGNQYRIIESFGEDQVGRCKAIHTSQFGFVWADIEKPDGLQRVRWNLLAPHPQPPRPEIASHINVWICPSCGDQSAFSDFCDSDEHDFSIRYVYRPVCTVEQIERARDAYIARHPEARSTIESFLQQLSTTPLLSDK